MPFGLRSSCDSYSSSRLRDALDFFFRLRTNMAATPAIAVKQQQSKQRPSKTQSHQRSDEPELEDDDSSVVVTTVGGAVV